MRTDINIWSHGVRLSAWHYSATSEALTNPAGRPVVVMAHGFGATRDAGLTPFAERFQAAGADVVIFDYRGFGASEGQPRHRVDHRRHREDYRAVISTPERWPASTPIGSCCGAVPTPGGMWWRSPPRTRGSQR